jgi:hypothetical protein
MKLFNKNGDMHPAVAGAAILILYYLTNLIERI